MKAILILALSFGGSLFAAGSSHWVATWIASPAPQLSDEQMRSLHLDFYNQTLREIVHTSIGGQTIRVRVSNIFNKQDLLIGAIHIAVRGHGSQILAGSDHVLMFGGLQAITVPADAVFFSDPVKLDVRPDSDLSISIYLPRMTMGAGVHYAAEQTSYVGAGNQVAGESITDSQTISSWAFLDGVDVEAPLTAGAVVAFGDSITDGARSTPDTNQRWPNELAKRLLSRKDRKLAVVDGGIGGNRVLHDGGEQCSFRGERHCAL